MSIIAVRPRTVPFRSKTGLLGALASLMALGVKADDPQVQSVRRIGYRHGKYSGSNPGAFGGPRRAKSHRQLYVAKGIPGGAS